MPSPHELLNLWSLASSQPIGLGIRTPPPTPTEANPAARLRQMLLLARLNAQPTIRAAFAHMGTRLSPEEPYTVLFLVKDRPQDRDTLPFPEEPA